MRAGSVIPHGYQTHGLGECSLKEKRKTGRVDSHPVKQRVTGVFAAAGRIIGFSPAYVNSLADFLSWLKSGAKTGQAKMLSRLFQAIKRWRFQQASKQAITISSNGESGKTSKQAITVFTVKKFILHFFYEIYLLAIDTAYCKCYFTHGREICPQQSMAHTGQ